jgi:hypothetical protein
MVVTPVVAVPVWVMVPMLLIAFVEKVSVSSPPLF